MFSAITKNPKTTGGAVVALILIVASVLFGVFESGLASLGSHDWPTLLASVAAAVGLLFSRDSDKSSEAVGAK